MDIKTIETFVRVTELKSFTKTAEEMNYVQSTVTMQIKQLEKELGYPLFDRIGKRVSLTALGSEFLKYAYEIMHAMEKAEALNGINEDIGGTLRVGVSESLLIGVLTDLLPTFKKRYKNLNISIKTGHTTELLEELHQNRLDMIYISKSLNTDPDLKCCYKREEELIFIASSESALCNKKKIPFNELMTNEFLVTEKEGICYGRLLQLAAQYNASVYDSVEIDSVAVIIELVKSGVGLAFLPEYAVEKHLVSKSLLKLDVDIEKQTYFSQILLHKSRWISPFMAGFIESIKTAMPEM